MERGTEFNYRRRNQKDSVRYHEITEAKKEVDEEPVQEDQQSHSCLSSLACHGVTFVEEEKIITPFSFNLTHSDS